MQTPPDDEDEALLVEELLELLDDADPPDPPDPPPPVMAPPVPPPPPPPRPVVLVVSAPPPPSPPAPPPPIPPTPSTSRPERPQVAAATMTKSVRIERCFTGGSSARRILRRDGLAVEVFARAPIGASCAVRPCAC